jgi:hypothetical protein
MSIFFGVILPIIGATGGLHWFVRILYEKWPWLYFAWREFTHILCSCDANWKVSVEYHGSFTVSAIDSIHKELSLRRKSVADSNRTPGKTWLTGNVDGMPFEARLAEERPYVSGRTEFGVLYLNMELRGNYRKSVRLVDRLTDTLESVENELKLSHGKYGATMEFRGKKNPYYGVHLRKVGLTSVISFNCSFRVPGDKKDKESESVVMVGKEKVELSTRSLVRFGSLSRDLLTMAT